MITLLNVALVIVAITIIVSVYLMPSKSGGANNIISGGNENYFSKNKATTYEGLLNKIIAVCAILFVVIVIALNLI